MTAGWALGRVVREARTRWERDWHALEWHAIQEWARFVLIGLIAVVSALFVAIAWIGDIPPGTGVLSWEPALLQRIADAPISFSTAVWLQTLGTDFTLLIVVLVTAGIATWSGRPLLAVTIVFAVVFMDAIVRIGWFALERPRPTVVAEGLASPGFHSFPSGHTGKTLTLYGLLAAQWLQASRNVLEKIMVVALAVVVAVVVPLGRLRMGVHWPTDILGGYALAAIWLAFILLALGRAARFPAPPA